jgi:hypothetical protein
MRALAWHGKHDVRVDTVDDPEILNPRDAIIKVTSTAICGSDLHLYDGYIPTMRRATFSAMNSWAKWSSRPQIDAEEGPARRRAVHHRVRQLLSLRQASIFGLRQRLPADNQDIAQELYGQPMSACSAIAT